MIAPTTLPSVLVVDDESGILDSLNILLRNEGFAPHLAHGGKAGLERIAEMSPDIVLTENGYTIAELNNVPGGIGLTAWLNRTYASLGQNVIGGAEGMIEGFRAILPDGAQIVHERPHRHRFVECGNHDRGQRARWVRRAGDRVAPVGRNHVANLKLTTSPSRTM